MDRPSRDPFARNLGLPGRRPGALRGRSLRRSAVRHGPNHLRVAAHHAPGAAGNRRRRSGRVARPGAVPGLRAARLRQDRSRHSGQRHAAHLGRTNPAAGGRAIAGNSRPAAANDPVLSVPRRASRWSCRSSPAPPSRCASFRCNNPMAQQRLLQLWWQQYAKPAGLFEPKPDYPPVVDNYLTTTLARRLNLRLPEARQTPLGLRGAAPRVGLNLGTESLQWPCSKIACWG